MKIKLMNGMNIENVTLCAPNTIDGSLVIEVEQVDIPRMAELTGLFGDPEVAALSLSTDGKGNQTEYAGYSRMKAAGYDGTRQILTVFMAQ